MGKREEQPRVNIEWLKEIWIRDHPRHYWDNPEHWEACRGLVPEPE